LGEDLRKIIIQNINRRLTKCQAQKKKLNCIIRGQTELTKFLPKFWKKLKPLRTIYLNM